MAYDFSKAETKDIVLLRDRTQDSLIKNPSSENAQAWQEYIADANKELNKRSTKNILMYTALGFLGYTILKSK